MSNKTHTLQLQYYPTIDDKPRIINSTLDELVTDWEGECKFCPENDAEIFSIVLDGNQLIGSESLPIGITFIGCISYLKSLFSGNFRKITDIEWDFDDDIAVLPTEVLVPKDWDDDKINDWLSDTYGFCVNCWAG